MQLHADECCSPSGRRKRVQSTVEGNVVADLIENRGGLGGRYQSRPMPPLLGSGEAVDLLKLFVHVKKRGGYDAISREGMWEVVGEDQGLACSGLGTAIKLIYYKYFLSSRRDLGNVSGAVDSEGEAVYGDLGLDDADLMCFAGIESKEREKNVEGSEEGSTDGVKGCDGKKEWTFGEEDVEVIEIDSDSTDLCDDQRASVETAVSKPDVVAKGATNYSGVEIHGKEETMVEELGATKEGGSSRKRKRKTDSTLSKMLDWLADVSKDPANPTIGTLPESSKWKSYGGEHCWKQVLLIRKALFDKRAEAISPDEQHPWQKKSKVHPSMFDEAGESAEKVRSSPRLRLSGFLGTQNNHISSLSSFNLRKRIPVGRFFQAEVPKWTGVPAESDSRWLGTRIWPPEEKSIKNVNEDDPAQKKTRDRCTLEYPGSLELIRSHISRRRIKLKVELGSAFYSWKFEEMGEEAATSWTKKDEKKFEAVVKENPFSQGKCFWDELSMSLPTKSRQELVSYYFNVFLLRRRAHQNRCIPSNIDSDDDETESIAKSSSSILFPGKKVVN